MSDDEQTAVDPNVASTSNSLPNLQARHEKDAICEAWDTDKCCEFPDNNFGAFKETTSSPDNNFVAFNEATPSNTKDKERLDKLAATTSTERRTFEPQFNTRITYPCLLEVIDKLELGKDTSTADKSCDERQSCCDDSSAIICDLLRKFDCSNESASDKDSNSDSDTNFRDVNSKSLHFWFRLRNVEEAQALKFLWNNSLAYLNLLHALGIDSNKYGDKIGPKASNNSTSSTQLSFRVSDGTTEQASSTCGDASDPATVDSLAVPPVTFDWRTSGLSNPLTGSSIPAMNALLACEFFSADASSAPGATPRNGKSILKRELDALGLGNENASSVKLNNNSLDVRHPNS